MRGRGERGPRRDHVERIDERTEPQEAHAEVFPQGGQGLESALYREHIEGREFLGLALYVDEAALQSGSFEKSGTLIVTAEE